MKYNKTKNILNINLRGNNLNNQNFQKVQAGHKFYYKLLLASFGLATACLLNIMPFLSGVFLFFVIKILLKYPSTLSLSLLFIEIIIYAASLIILIIYGYQVKSSYFIAVLIVIGAILSIAPSTYYSGIGWTIVLLGLSITSAWIGSGITALSVAFTSSCYGIIGEFITVLGSGITAIALPVIVKNIQTKTENVEVILNSIATILVIFIGAIIARKAIRGSPKFTWIREKSVFWVATGGTSFYGANLTDACFDGAHLPHTDFRGANLTRTSFEEVTGLEFSRLEGTILENPQVRKLLIKKRGYNQDYTGANFSGANLKNADLTEACLNEINALDADFSEATLTGASIQGWNINKNTRFTNVKCKYIFLERKQQGDIIRKPDSGEFKAGEFEKWISELQKTIDLIFREGLNWKAFIFSLAQTAINHEGLDLSRYSITRDENLVFAQIGLFTGADHRAIHEEFTSCYENAVKLIDSNYQLILQAKDGELERLRELLTSNYQIVRELASVVAGTGRQVLIHGTGNRVYMLNQAGDIMESKNEGINIGGNVGGNLDTGDKISAARDMNLTASSLTGTLNNVTNMIQQLSDVKTDGSDELVKILTTLQKSIADDAALSDSKKKEALEAVEMIAAEGKKPQGERKLNLCSMAVNALKGIASAVTDASKLAEVFKTYLPALTSILGL